MPELEPVDLVFTDPPYNCSKDYGEYKDNLSETDYHVFISSILNVCFRLAEKQAWVAPRYKMRLFLNLFNEVYLKDPHIIVVRRGARGPFRGGWSDQFETILTIGKPNKCDVDLWEHRLKGEGYFFTENAFGHPGYTPYPITSRCICLLSQNSVLDPFFGTGTTGVVCEELNRRWIGIEISEKYCEIAAKRISNEAKQLKLFR